MFSAVSLTRKTYIKKQGKNIIARIDMNCLPLMMTDGVNCIPLDFSNVEI